jgi:uncharacterized membrane protein YgaE (UPF0421/DUF939 family)
MDIARSLHTAAFAGVGHSALDQSRQGISEVRNSWRLILQATVAASLAYGIAESIGHEVPFFAPIAAIATVAVSLAHRRRRTVELLVGNAIGILLADFLVARIGTGAWQVGLVVALALTAALIAGGGPILVMQACTSAILIATLTPPTADNPVNTGRFVDALIGGGIGLVVSALLLPVHPARHARSSTDPVLDVLRDGYRRVGEALRTTDTLAAEAALADLRATASVLQGFHSGLAATRESIRLAPWYWGQRQVLDAYADAGFHLDNALRNLRVLARQAALALDRGEPVPQGIPAALAELAEAADRLGPALATEGDPEPVRRLLLVAVAHTHGVAAAESSAPVRPGLFNAPMIAQIRLSASDLLQATGMPENEAADVIRAAGDAQD